MTTKIGSLFDGSGGFPLAAALCGFEPAWASEVEPYPIAVTRSHFPYMIHLGDVSKVNGADIEPVDVITFGSPCQDMSIAGKRAGIKHTGNGDKKTTRSGLFMEAVRIIKEMREATHGRYPTFAVWENVPGAFSSNKGEDFRLVLEELIKIKESDAEVPPADKNGWPYADLYMGDGWSLAYRTFDAQYWGIPQRRRRIYLVADFRGQRAGKILFEREGFRGHFAEGRTPWERTAADAKGSAGADCVWPRTANCLIARADGSPQPDKGTGANVIVLSAAFKAGQGAQARSIGYEHEKCPTLTAEAGGSSVPVICVAYDARGNGDGKTVSTIIGDHENRVTDYTTVVCIQGNCIDRADTAGCNGKVWAEDVCYTLNTIDRPAVAYGVDCRNMNETTELYPTLQAKPNGGQSLNFSGAVRVCYIVRRLTPTECARLQGFPDKWGKIEPMNPHLFSDVAFWRQAYLTHCEISGKSTRQSILMKPEKLASWHDNLHTDSAEYKMWGNGIALPNALYVMQGLADALAKEEQRD